MMMNYMDPLAGMYQDYDRYVRTAEAEGKKPVSPVSYTHLFSSASYS